MFFPGFLGSAGLAQQGTEVAVTVRQSLLVLTVAREAFDKLLTDIFCFPVRLLCCELGRSTTVLSCQSFTRALRLDPLHFPEPSSLLEENAQVLISQCQILLVIGYRGKVLDQPGLSIQGGAVTP